MTDEEKKLLQSLYNLKGASVGLSPKQAELLQKLEDKLADDEILPAVCEYVVPLLRQLQGDFTLQVIRTANQQRVRIMRNEPTADDPSDKPQDNVPTTPAAQEPDNPVESEPAPDPKDKRKRKRPNFRFSMVGIRPGEWVTFVPTGLQVKVVTDNKVEYGGQLYKLSPFVGKFLPDDQRNSKDAYQGPRFFSYHGRLLDDLRPDTRKKRTPRR